MIETQFNRVEEAEARRPFVASGADTENRISTVGSRMTISYDLALWRTTLMLLILLSVIDSTNARSLYITMLPEYLRRRALPPR
jgi:hypothetical protein